MFRNRFDYKINDLEWSNWSPFWIGIDAIYDILCLDSSGNRKLPGTNCCGGPGCRPLITVNNNGSYSYNQRMCVRFLSTVPTVALLFFFFLFPKSIRWPRLSSEKDVGGPFGRRILAVELLTGHWELKPMLLGVSSGDWLIYSNS